MALFGNTSNDNSIVINITANDNAKATIRNVRAEIDNAFGNTTTFGNASSGLDGVAKKLDAVSSYFGKLGISFAYIGNQMGQLNDGIINGMMKVATTGVSYIQNAIDKYRELSEVQGELAGVVGNNIDPTTGKVDKEKNAQTTQTIISNAKKSAQTGKLWTEEEYDATATELYKTGITGVADNYDTMEMLMKFKTANGLTDEEVGQTMAILQQRDKNIGDPATMMRYLNQIQASADLSPADVSDIIKSMSYGDPLARSMNMDFASEMALIAGFSSGGYSGSQGGTMLRRTLQNLPISSLKLSQLSKVKSAGLEEQGLLDYWGAFAGEFDAYNSTNDPTWTKRFDLLEQYMNGDVFKKLYGTDMTENQRMMFGYTLLGTQGEALPSLLKGMGFDEDFVNTFVTAGNGTGVEDKYSAKADTLDGAMSRLENAFASVTAEVGSKFAPLIMEFVDELFNGKGLDKDKLRGLFENAIQEIGDIAKDFLPPELITKLKEFGGKMFDFVWALGDTSLEVLPQILDRLIGIGDTLLEAFDGGNVDFGKLASALFQFFNLFSDLDLSGIKDADTKAIGEGITGIVNFLQKVGTIGDGLSKFAVVLVTLSTIGSLLSGVFKIFSGLAGFFGDIGGGFGAGSTMLGGLGEVIGGDLGDAVEDAFGEYFEPKGIGTSGTGSIVPVNETWTQTDIPIGTHQTLRDDPNIIDVDYSEVIDTAELEAQMSAEGTAVGSALGSGIKTAILEAGIPLAVAGILALVIKAGIEKAKNQTDEEKSDVKKDLNRVERKQTAKDEIQAGKDLDGDGYIGYNYGVNEGSGAGRELSKDRKNNKNYQKSLEEGYGKTAEEKGLVPVTEIGGKKGKSFNGTGKADTIKLDVPKVEVKTNKAESTGQTRKETQPVIVKTPATTTPAKQTTERIINNNTNTPVVTPVNTDVNTTTNLQNNTHLNNVLNTSSNWSVHLSLPVTVNHTTTITRTISGSRSSTNSTNKSVSNSSSQRISGQR